MDKNFIKKIENLYKNKNFSKIKFEIDALEDTDKKNPFVYNIQGIIESLNGNFDKAKSFFQLAIKEDKYFIHSLLNLAKNSYLDKDFENIIFLLKNYHKKNPKNYDVILNLANLTFAAGYLEDAIKFHKKLIETNKFELKDLSALISLFNYSSYYSEETYKKYCEIYNSILTKNKHTYKININEHNKFKIGFLSYDLKEHSVGYFLKDFIKELKINNYIPIAFNLADPKKHSNNFILELKKTFSEWHDVIDLNDKDLSEFIYEKKIFFLFDLAGYTVNNRLQIYKNKPAPIQISWIGYCNKTYINQIDYLIVDPYVIPQENKKILEKELIKLPKIWNVFSKPDDLEINDLPVLKNKNFTFGSFNNFLKISDEVIEIWSTILNNVQNSRLILKSSLQLDKNYKNYLLKKFKLNNSKKIIFLDYEKDKKKHLKQYNQIDVSLDTFPYNGVTTSFESIWMGVPVLTLKGNNFISRCGFSINKNINMEQFIAENKNDYILKATNLALNSNYKDLNIIRKSLREKALLSPLFNTENFTENFIKKLKEISLYD